MLRIIATLLPGSNSPAWITAPLAISSIQAVMMSNAVKTTGIAMMDGRLTAVAAIGGTIAMMSKARVVNGAVDIAIVG